MAGSVVGEVAVRVRGDTTMFKRDVSKAASSPAIAGSGVVAGKKAGGGFSKAFGAAGFAGTLGKTGVAGAVAVLAIGIGKSLVGAAQDAERQMTAVNASLKASGVSAPKAAAAIAKVSKSAIALGFDDEDAAASLATLTRASGSVGRATTLQAAAMDVARAKNVDLATATKVVTLAQLGNVRGLKQLGITVAPVTAAQDKLQASIAKLKGESKGADDATKARIATQIAALKATTDEAKADDVRATSAKAISTIQKQLGTQAEEFAKTTSGAQARASVAFQNLKESAGKALLPLVAIVAESLVPAFEGLATGIEATVDFIRGVWTRWGDQITTVAQTVGRLVVAYIRPGFELVKGIIKTVTALLHGDWQAAWDAAKATVRNVVNAVVALVRSTLGKLPGLVLSAASAAVGALRSGLAAMPGIALSIATRAGSAIATGIKSAIGKLAGLAGDLLGKVSAAISQVAGQAAGLAVGIGTAIINGVKQGVINAAEGLARAAEQAVRDALQRARDLLPFSEPKNASSPFRNLAASGVAVIKNLSSGILASKKILGSALVTTLKASLAEQSRAAASALAGTASTLAQSIATVLDAKLAKQLGALDVGEKLAEATSSAAFASRVAEIAATGGAIAAAEAAAAALQVDSKVQEAAAEVARLRAQALTIDKGLTDALAAARTATVDTKGFAARRAADAAFFAAQGAVNDALVVATKERNTQILAAETALSAAKTESDKFYFEQRKALLEAEIAATSAARSAEFDAERSRQTALTAVQKEASEQALSALALNLSERRITIAQFDQGVKDLLANSVGDYASIGSDLGLGLGQSFGAQFLEQIRAVAEQAAQVLRGVAASGFESTPTGISISGNVGDQREKLKAARGKVTTEAGDVAEARKAVAAAKAAVEKASKTKDTKDDKTAQASLTAANKALDTQEAQLAAAKRGVTAQEAILKALERIEATNAGSSSLGAAAVR